MASRPGALLIYVNIARMPDLGRAGGRSGSRASVRASSIDRPVFCIADIPAALP
jgi:hypothetical protein